MPTINEQIAALEAQKVAEKMEAEAAIRTASVAEVLEAMTAEVKAIATVTESSEPPQIHPEWVYVNFLPTAPTGKIQPLMEKLVELGGELGLKEIPHVVVDAEGVLPDETVGVERVRVTGRVYVHKNIAKSTGLESA